MSANKVSEKVNSIVDELRKLYAGKEENIFPILEPILKFFKQINGDEKIYCKFCDHSYDLKIFVDHVSTLKHLGEQKQKKVQPEEKKSKAKPVTVQKVKGKKKSDHKSDTDDKSSSESSQSSSSESESESSSSESEDEIVVKKSTKKTVSKTKSK